MLNENAIDKLIQPLINRQEQINTAVIMKIAKRIKEIQTMLPSDVYKLETLLKNGSDVREINAELAVLTQLQEQEIKNIIKNVAADAYEDTKPFYDYRELSYIPYAENEQLQKTIKAIEKETIGEYRNLSQSTAFMLRDTVNPKILKPMAIAETYQKAVDLGIQSVAMGAESYNTAISKTIKELVSSGLKTAEYTTEDGKVHYQRLDTAVRRNILDGIRAVNQCVQDVTGEQFGANGVEINVHSFSAPDHEPIQGHQFTKTEYEKLQNGEDFCDVNGKVFAAIKRPIGYWNCRHFAWNIIIGCSTPNYTEKELEELIKRNNKGYGYVDAKGNKKHLTMYQCTQKQRSYELDIRRAKEGKAAAEKAGDSQLAAEYQAEIIQKQNEYKAFCKGCGLKTRFENTRIFI